MHRIVVLALDGVLPFELGIPARVFGSAQTSGGAPLYEVVTCSLDGGTVRTCADFAIAVEHDGTVLDTADTVIIPSGHGPLFEGNEPPPRLAGALERIRPGTRLVSLCTGSFILAGAGLLDGLPATTHWARADEFQRLFPRVKLDPDVLFVDNGDLLTSAGCAAAIDLCLHLVRRDHGSEVANGAARRCVVPPWRDGGQAQYIERPLPEPSVATTGPTRAWALERLHLPLSLAQMAAHAGMSVRTFTRRFREEVGMSPGQWLGHQRVELARHLLETTDLPVDRIAERAGFGTGASLRKHLREALGVAPLAYRRTFRATDQRAFTSV
ncbi:GlxA family transcriptional regulator [Thermomonospora cellulosilytica]|uniref:Transcriptional regulator GlxA family with amidase domain n=1 Tax=Thermomonospora cellulosilytica TaxID=1411118 RepID=A0A7W3R745_9ACTN|nr:helix-turn-helix domain-containing protein [Thermomonospora cellulosilytica]MBA9002099.1 transcriptional regulator GlxA family with amidase domain [Thermomonospora cellulosilytica]